MQSELIQTKSSKLEVTSSTEAQWQQVLQDYDPIDGVGAGSYGKVVKAKCKSTGKTVAIKLIENVFGKYNLPRYMIRELELMHQLS